MEFIDILILTVCAVMIVAGMVLGYNEETK